MSVRPPAAAASRASAACPASPARRAQLGRSVARSVGRSVGRSNEHGYTCRTRLVLAMGGVKLS